MPSQADDGTIVAVRGTRFYKLDRTGRLLARLPSLLTDKPDAIRAVGPVDARISPDGRTIASWLGIMGGWFDHATNTYCNDRSQRSPSRTPATATWSGLATAWPRCARARGWATDGRALTWSAPDGIWTTPVGDGCGSLQEKLIVPGGREPDWGPADHWPCAWTARCSAA